MKFTVKTALFENTLDAPTTIKGRDLFQMLSKTLGIQETWWFGLMFDDGHLENWIDGSKKSLKDYVRQLNNLQYKVKYYPEDVTEELIETITIKFFYAEVRSKILAEVIYCPPDTCALLASYSLQCKFSDCNEKSRKKAENFKLIPDSVLKKHSMKESEWLESIIGMWEKHKGLDAEEAMMEYLKLAQNLEMFGVDYFHIKNKKGSDILLGVTALGLNMYKPDDKLNPTINFPWSEIKNLKFKDTKFIIKPTDKNGSDFVFFTDSPRASKYILALGIGNHSLYIRRRKPELPEVIKLREKANEIRKNNQLQREKYRTERLKREELERRENIYKEEIEKMRREMQLHQSVLEEANRTIRRLQEQLEDLQRSKEELEQQRKELQEMMQRLEDSKNMEAAEKQKLEDEIRAKHDEVQRIQNEVAKKDEETRRLQEEVEEAKRREEEVKRQQMEEAAKLEEERRRREEEEAQRKENERELEQLANANNQLPELQRVNEHLTEQLKMLQSKLEATRSQEEETQMDKIHRANLLENRDKYKTLADIRRGNTVRRVEMFENM